MLLTLSVALYGQPGIGHGRLTGTVVDDDGNPVGSAKIILRFIKSRAGNSLAPIWREESAVLETTTDKKGKWTYQGLAGGIWEVEASQFGYDSASRQVQVRQLADNLPVDLKIEKTGGGSFSIAGDMLEEANELSALGRYDEAIPLFRKYLETDPRSVMVMLHLGDILLESGRLDEAGREFQTLVEMTGDDPGDREIASRALAGLGECSFRKGDREKAIEHLKRSIEASPTSETVAANLAQLLFSTGQDDEAIYFYRKALEMVPDRQDIRLGLVNVYLHQGRFDKARDELDRIIRSEPNSRSAAQAQKILAEISNKRPP